MLRFRGKEHRELFRSVLSELDNPGNDYLAALYILTSRTSLWRKLYGHMVPVTLTFDPRKFGKLSAKEYTLVMAAKDIYCGSSHMQLSDLTDPEIVSDSAYRLITTAMIIRKYGVSEQSVVV